jgi:hypothetical protein
MFPDEKYLGAWDLEGRKGVVVVIDRVGVEELTSQRGKDHKPVAHFRGKKKGMVLNKTNCKTIAALYGKDADDWIGKAVEIYATTCSAGGGEEVECLRIRPRRPPMPGAGQETEEGEADQADGAAEGGGAA